MENCLVTKMKGIVNNPDLPYFNSLKITFVKKVDTPADNKLTFKISGVCTISTDENHVFYVGDSSTGVHSYEINSESYVNIKGQNENYNIIVTPKNTIKAFNNISGTDSYYFNIEELNDVYTTLNVSNVTNVYGQLKHSKALTISISSTSAYVDFDDFEYSITSQWFGGFDFSYTNSKGSIQHQGLINAYASTTRDSNCVLKIQYTSVSGDIATFANAVVTAGKTAGIIDVQSYNNNVTKPSGVGNTFKIKFGTSMSNPTTEETTQGWQIV